MADAQTEHDVILRLELDGDCSQEELQDLAETILEAVEEHASETALGPVVSGEFNPLVIELDFSVLAESRADVQQAAVDVLRTIEAHTPVECVIGTSVAQREPVPA